MVNMRAINEKNMDDFVYEDAYYEDVLKNNENIDDVDGNENQENMVVQTILVCEDCTHQWEDLRNAHDDSPFCPMCGSVSVMLI